MLQSNASFIDWKEERCNPLVPIKFGVHETGRERTITALMSLGGFFLGDDDALQLLHRKIELYLRKPPEFRFPISSDYTKGRTVVVLLHILHLFPYQIPPDG